MKSKNMLLKLILKIVCFYFDDIINDTKTNFSNILLNEKLYENISFYKISYKTPAYPKPLRIRFNKIDGFIISLDGKIKCSYILYLIRK